MAESTILIYHMADGKAAAIGKICSAMGIRTIKVEKKYERSPVGLLTGMLDPVKLMSKKGALESRGPVEIDEEMIVMAGFTRDMFDRLLDDLKSFHLPVSLKAVQTETNLYWSGEMLQAELKRERELFRKMK